jgi:hypothetical protein
MPPPFLVVLGRHFSGSEDALKIETFSVLARQAQKPARF